MVQNLKIAESRVFILEAFRLTLFNRIYLHLPWLGNVSLRYEMQIKTAVKRCYFAVEPCIVYTIRQLLPVAKNDVLPAFHQSNIVYQFLCHCDSR